MIVGILKMDFFLAANRSLKGKRKVVKSIIDRVRVKFNVAVAEIASNELWQKMELGFVVVANESRHVDSMLNEICSYVRSISVAEVIDVEMELMSI